MSAALGMAVRLGAGALSVLVHNDACMLPGVSQKLLFCMPAPPPRSACDALVELVLTQHSSGVELRNRLVAQEKDLQRIRGERTALQQVRGKGQACWSRPGPAVQRAIAANAASHASCSNPAPLPPSALQVRDNQRAALDAAYAEMEQVKQQLMQHLVTQGGGAAASAAVLSAAAPAATAAARDLAMAHGIDQQHAAAARGLSSSAEAEAEADALTDPHSDGGDGAGMQCEPSLADLPTVQAATPPSAEQERIAALEERVCVLSGELEVARADASCAHAAADMAARLQADSAAAEGRAEEAVEASMGAVNAMLQVQLDSLQAKVSCRDSLRRCLALLCTLMRPDLLPGLLVYNTLFLLQASLPSHTTMAWGLMTHACAVSGCRCRTCRPRPPQRRCSCRRRSCGSALRRGLGTRHRWAEGKACASTPLMPAFAGSSTRLPALA